MSIENRAPRLMEGAVCEQSKLSDGVTIYPRGEVFLSSLGTCSSIGNDSVVTRSIIGSFVQVNRRNYINDSILGDLTFTGQNTMAHFCKIGRCCSIAANVDIGGFNHDYTAVSTFPIEKFDVAAKRLGIEVASDDYYDANDCSLEIGNDVWIASGAIVLRKASIGDGAVVGAGAVVTKPVPPYAIAIGVPAKVVGYRFDESTIEKLLSIAWWNWEPETIVENRHLLIGQLNASKLELMARIGDEQMISKKTS